MSLRLLETKFHVPVWKKQSVSRLRLVEQLQVGIAEQRKLTLISAPPGYGKTTLVEEWCHSLTGDERVAWLSLDDSDNDPAHFLLYFMSALQRIDKNLGQGALSMLGIPQMPPLTSFFDELINDLSGQEKKTILVLDDYHIINNSDLNQAVEYFIDHLPELFHLVITTRQDPPFSLARLRASGLLTEIRARELRFTIEEVTRFFNESIHLNLPPDDIQILASRTEGWAVGLQLSALAMKNIVDHQDFLTDFSGSHRYIVDYLLDEVLKSQPPEIHEFLEKTSVLTRFNADLCQTVTGNENCIKILNQLEKSNLFLTPLDTQRGWYRYHHLFADVLQAGLSTTDKEKCFTRAAAWFESQGLFAESISYWIKAKSYDSASRLIGLLVPDLIRTGELQTLLGWLNSLPEEIISRDSEMVSYKALSLVLTGQINQAQEFVERTNLPPSEQSKINQPGRLLAMQSLIASLIGKGDPGTLAEEALAQFEGEDLIFRALALISIGNSFGWKDDLRASSQAFRDAWEISKRSNHPFIGFIALTNLVFNLLDMGNLHEAESLCREALAAHLDARGRHLPVAAILYSPLSLILFDKGDFEEARRIAETGIAICRKLSINNIMGGVLEITLARIAFEDKRVQEAFDLLQKTIEDARQRGMVIIIYKCVVVQIDFFLLQGKHAEAKMKLDELKSLSHSDLWDPDPVLSWFSVRYQVAIDPSDKELAVLDDLVKDSTKKGFMKRLVSALICKAGALHQRNKFTEASQVLQSALRIAAPEDYLSLFIPHPGRPIQALLSAVRDTAPDFVDGVLKFSRPAQARDNKLNLLPDPLSEQEMRVLKLILAGKSNQEIAVELVISVGTAKWHVHNVLRKLDVNNRPQAMARAIELGLDS